MYLLGILCLVAATAALPVLPDPPTLLMSNAANQGSKMHTNIQNAATDFDSLRDNRDVKELKKDTLKIASVVVPRPSQLPPFDYSVLRKRKAYQKLKYEDSVKPEAETFEKDKGSVILEKPLIFQVPTNPSTLKNSIRRFQDSEGRANIPSIAADCTSLANDKDNKKINNNVVKIALIVILPPPELLYDYSNDQKKKCHDALMHQAHNFKKAQESAILENSLKVQVPLNSPILTNFITGLQDSEVPTNILSVITDAAPETNKTDDRVIKDNMAKITLVIITTSPALPLFYNSNSKNEIKQILDYTLKQEPDKSKDGEEVAIINLKKPVNVKVPQNSPKFPGILTELRDSDVHANIIRVPSDNAQAENSKYNEEVEHNTAKIATVVVPAPPELPPFDYSILQKLFTDQKQKFYDAQKKEADNLKKEKETVIIEKSFKVQVPPNPPILSSSITERQDSDVHANILRVDSGYAPAEDSKYNEEVEHNSAKIATVVVPAPPELPPFDYSILQKQFTDQKQKFYDAQKKEADNLKKEKETVVIEKSFKVQVPPNPPTVSSSIRERQDSDVHANILRVDSDYAPAEDSKYNEEVEHNTAKIATVVVPAPPELPPFDYSILQKQFTDQKQKFYDAQKKETDNLKKEKETVVIEKSFKVQVPPNPPILSSSITERQDSDVHANILRVDSDYAPAEDSKYNEEVEHNSAKIATVVVPAPPELPPFDYSFLQKQFTDQKQKFYDAQKKEADNLKKEKETVVIEKSFKVQVPPNPPILSSSITERQDSDVHANILRVDSGYAPAEDSKYNEEVEHNSAKIATVVVPAPPELPPFDYSILQKQFTDQKQKFYDAQKKEADNLKKEKETVVIEKSFKVQVPPNTPTVSSSIRERQDSDVHANILRVDSDYAPAEDSKYNEEVEHNTAKIATVVVPVPPELPPFDYSILQKQFTEQKQKFYDAQKKETDNLKKEKETVVIEKSFKVQVPPNPPILSNSITERQDSDVHANILRVDSDYARAEDSKYNEEVEHNTAKIATVVVPAPPELPPFDYSILQKQLTDQKQKFYDAQKKETDNLKKEKETVVIEKSFKVQVPPNPPILSSSITERQDSDVHANILRVDSDYAPAEDSKYNEEVEHNSAKIATVVVPAPPELPPFDYSILQKQFTDQKQKFYDAQKKEADNLKKEKETVVIEKSFKVQVPPNPPILSSSITERQDSDVHANILRVDSGYAPAEDSKYNEEVEHNSAKIATVVVPAPPELPPFDYSILQKQFTDQKQKFYDAQKKEADNLKKEKETVVIEKSFKVQVPPNTPTVSSSIRERQDSDVHANILRVDSDYAPAEDSKYNEEVEHNTAKIATVVVPAPPELPPFDYSILQKQFTDQKQKFYDAQKKETDNLKKEKETVVIEKSFKVQVPPNPPILSSSITERQDSDVHANILRVDSDYAPAEDSKYNEEVEHNSAKIATVVVPAPPELPPFDYSILQKQFTDQKQKFYDAQKKEADNLKKEKETVVIEKSFKVQVPPNPPILSSSITERQDSDVHANILRVASDYARAEDSKYNEEVEHNTAKIATVVVPAPPELPPFDYSILQKQFTDQKQKFYDAQKKEADNLKKEKETVVIEKSFKVQVPPNPPILSSSITERQDSDVHANILRVASDYARAEDSKYNEEVEHNTAKIATVVVPAPPELPPFDYSILQKQFTDQKQKLYEADNFNKEKVPVTQVHMNILNVATDATPVLGKKDNVEVNMVKISSGAIPAPPELQPFDYSILRKHKGIQKQKSEDFLQAEKFKKDIKVLKLEKTKPIEEYKYLENPETMEESKPFRESKHIEKPKKKPVKCADDNPVIIKMTIPSKPFLSKLIPNCLSLPCSNWPSRRSHKIYPKNINSKVHTN